MELTLQQAAKELRESVRDATRNIVDRDLIVDLILLSAVAGEHLLIIGPPGTAKSAVVRSEIGRASCRERVYAPV